MSSSRGRPALPAPLAGARGWWAVAAVWTAMGLLESIKAYVTARAIGRPAPVGLVLVGNLPWWLFWGALTPAVFLLCRRLGFFPGERWARALAVHVPAALLLAVLHLTITAVVYQRTNAPAADLGRMWGTWLSNFLFLELFTYASIVAAYHALVHYRLFRERQEAAARLELEQERLGREMARAKLQALQMELQPHFLFNTFNAITALVRRNENRAAVEMLVRLSELLRHTLERGGTPLVTLAEEVDLARAYLEIQQVRFPGLDVAVEVDPRAARALVPTLVLQPLVENAVRHGLAGRGEGRVRIRGTVEPGGRLRVEVEDTGGGGPLRVEVEDTAGGRPRRAGEEASGDRAPDATGPSEAGSAAGPPLDGRGVGLGNTRARLEQLWGERAGLRLERTDRGGTRVVLDLPLTPREDARGGNPASLAGGGRDAADLEPGPHTAPEELPAVHARAAAPASPSERSTAGAPVEDEP